MSSVQVLHMMSVYRSRCMSCVPGPISDCLANVEEIQLHAVFQVQNPSQATRGSMKDCVQSNQRMKRILCAYCQAL